MTVLDVKHLEIRLTVLVGLALFGFSLIAGIFTYVLGYRHEFADADAVQRQLVRTVQAQAEVAAFARNANIAEGVLDGLLANPVVLAARIESSDGFLVSRSAGGVVDFNSAKTYPLLSPVDHQEHIGTLMVVQNDAHVAQMAASAALLQTGLMLGQVFIAVIIMATVLRVLLIHPITRLARAIGTIQPGSRERLSVDASHAGDEIGLLAYSANALLDAAETAIDEVKEQRNELERLATHDPLTGLPTMRLAEDRLHVACTGALRTGTKVALLFVDLDGFKGVNDNYGHQTGDEVLREVALRLQTSMRAEDTVARLGGDEFLVILSNLSDVQDSARVAKEIIAALSRAMQLGGHQIQLGASIGIAVYPDHVGDVKAMRHLADKAMYKVKRAGKGAYAFADGITDD